MLCVQPFYNDNILIKYIFWSNQNKITSRSVSFVHSKIQSNNTVYELKQSIYEINLNEIMEKNITSLFLL